MAKSPIRIEFVDVPPQPRPFLARYPWVGYSLFIVFGAVFAWLSWQVKIQGPITQGDLPLAKNIFQWAKQQPPWFVFLMRFLSAYGRDGLSLIALILVIGWARKKARRELRMLLFGVMGGELWFQILGNLVRRPRPAFKDPFEKLIGFGYPSGHAVTNLLLAWMIMYLILPHVRSGWVKALIIIANVAMVFGICFSRMFLGLHYLTDILGGLTLGLAWGGLIYTLIDVLHWRQRPGEVRLTPPVAAPALSAATIPVTAEEQEQQRT